MKIATEELRNLVDDVTLDRDIGTEDHWWHSQVSDFYLDEDFGAYDDQKASDKRRILRLPEIERAAVALAAELITARAKMEAAARLAEALERAKMHLEYCGYGDAWERNVLEGPDPLDRNIEAALAAWGAAK